jgi:multicomponent Na+:H+ antiporter subunit D
MASETGATADASAAMVTAPVQASDWLVILPVIIPIVAGAILLMFRKEARIHAGVAMLALALVVLADLALLIRVLEDGPLVMTMGRWLPPFGISFAADALGASFALTGAIVAFVCAAYAARDIGVTGRRYGFYPFLMLLMAGIGGAFLTGDIFNLYVWFEVFLISSFGLLILGSEDRQIDGATKYAFLNLVATTLFLVTTGYLYGVFGTLNMADIARQAAGVREAGPLMTLATLYLLAFGMKAAAFPVNFWLPASYHTPAIVTSALFAGLLTKIGVYALLRTLVMLFPPEREALSELIAWVAAATMLLGILGALAQSDIRRILGFVVISGIGVMLAGLAVGSPLGLSGTILYAVHSMLATTALYLLAGMMKEAGGSYSIGMLGGLYLRLPMLAALALMLILSVSGLPPFFGLWPKVMLVKASLDGAAWWLALAILASSLLTILALGRVFILAFWRDGQVQLSGGAVTRPAGIGYAALFVLVAPIVAIGVYPEPAIGVATQAAEGLLDTAAYIGAVFPGGGGQ